VAKHLVATDAAGRPTHGGLSCRAFGRSLLSAVAAELPCWSVGGRWA
jgi:hypothetical protein